MCSFLIFNFLCGHAEQKLLLTCRLTGCTPKYDERSILFSCEGCHAPTPGSFGIVNAQPVTPQEHMPNNGEQRDIFEFIDFPGDDSHVDPRLLQKNETEVMSEYEQDLLLPTWNVAENTIAADIDSIVQPIIEIGEASAGQAEMEVEMDATAIPEYPPLPRIPAWNAGPGNANPKDGENDADNQFDIEFRRQMMTNYITPAPFSDPDSGLFEDSGSSASPAAKRFEPKELSPTPGARDFDSYTDAAHEALDRPILWLGSTLREFLNSSEDLENEHEHESKNTAPSLGTSRTSTSSASSPPPIPQPDFSRDYPDFPDAETLGIEKPSPMDLPILRQEVQKAQLERALQQQHQDKGSESRGLSVGMDMDQDMSASPAFSTDSTISMYSTTSSTKSIRKRRRKAFRLTMPKYGGKKRAQKKAPATSVGN